MVANEMIVFETRLAHFTESNPAKMQRKKLVTEHINLTGKLLLVVHRWLALGVLNLFYPISAWWFVLLVLVMVSKQLCFFSPSR